MPSEVNKIESRHQLRFAVTRTPSLLEVILGTVVPGGAVFIFASMYLEVLLAATAGICAAVIAIPLARRANRVELHVAQTELELHGRIDGSFRSGRTVRSADIQWLQYEESSDGADNSGHPSGLYAMLAHRSVCVLPYLDEKQTHTVMDLIEEKFPELQKRWARGSSFGRNFTSLGL